MSDSSVGRTPEYLVAEYEAATAAYLHYDSFRWQSGSLLVAGAFVFLGFLAAGDPGEIVDFGALLVAFVMSVWLTYAQHHRILYLFKLDRIAELERLMGAEQNLRFRGEGERAYPRLGMPGHNLDRLMAVGLSVSGAILALLKSSAGIFSILAILLSLGTVIWVIGLDRRAQQSLRGR